jgi:hypothetical protein
MVWFKYVRFLVSKWRPVYIRTSQVQLPRRTIWPTFRAIRHLRLLRGKQMARVWWGLYQQGLIGTAQKPSQASE